MNQTHVSSFISLLSDLPSAFHFPLCLLGLYFVVFLKAPPLLNVCTCDIPWNTVSFLRERPVTSHQSPGCLPPPPFCSLARPSRHSGLTWVEKMLPGNNTEGCGGTVYSLPDRLLYPLPACFTPPDFIHFTLWFVQTGTNLGGGEGGEEARVEKGGVTFLNAVAACCLPAAAPPPLLASRREETSPLSCEELSLMVHVSAEKLAPPRRACLSAGAKNTRRQMHHMPGRRHALMKESSVLRGSRCLLFPGGLFEVPLLEAVRRKSSFGTILCCFNSVSCTRQDGFSNIMLRLGFFFVYSTVEKRHLASAKDRRSTRFVREL